MKIVLNRLLKIDSEDIVKGKLIIPEGVTEIATGSLKNYYDLQEVYMPDSLKVIGEKTFFYCERLKTVKFSKNLEAIKEDAFGKCFSLKDITLPDSIKEIQKGAFYSCDSLQSINIPKSLKKIEKMAFSYCNELDNIFIPENIETIGDSAFYSCKGLNNIKIAEGVKNIDTSAFFSCGQLSNINIPSTVKSIGSNAFSYCVNLKNIELSEGLQSIGHSAFGGSGIESIVIPNSVNNLEYAIFRFCQSLESAVLPDHLEKIENELFLSCSSLKNIKLPENLKIIGESEFTKCSSLENLTLPKNLKIIDTNSFKGCKNLKNITLPESVIDLGAYAFAESGVEEIKIPENIKSLKDHLFDSCENLKEVKLPNKLFSIENFVFNNCQNLKTINLPESLNKINDSAFNACSSLTSLNLPENVVKIGNNAFSNCSNLQSIIFSNKLKTIGNYAFQFAPITKIDLPDSVDFIGNFAFDGCSKLEKVKLPKNLSSISNGLFQRCSNLSKIDIPNSVKSIGSYAFALANFNEIAIPENVKTLGNGVFYNNPKLTTITLPESLNTIKAQVFDSCPSLKEINIPNSVTELGSIRDFNFFEKTENGFKLSNDQSLTSLPINSLKVSLPFLSRHWDYKSIILKDQNNYKITNLYNEVISKLPEDEIQKFLSSHNFTFLKKMNISNNSENLTEMYNFIYNMGVVSTPVEINGKRVDYAQKSSEFLRLLDDRNICKTFEFKNIFKDMKIQGLKPEFVDFFMKDFDKLYEQEKLNPGFLARCYNEFEKVQKTNTNHHGSQRQLKPTVEKFVDYFKENKFSGIVDENTQIISDTISPYFSNQEQFNNAISIDKERISKKTPNSILSFHLKEENPFKIIDNLAENISDLQNNTLKNMLSVATNEFSFDWLQKNDPQNFILGNLCSCCAHLDGAGYGIMHASIVHPNIQNLVVRNKDGEIIAKSTLYINPSECFGVFNNVEVNTNVTDAEKKKIYQKYIKGVNAFAEAYNKEHPDKQLKQINVGLSNNDLLNELKNDKTYAPKVLKAINYAEFGYGDHNYPGDSFVDQMIVWTNKNYQIENEKQ